MEGDALIASNSKAVGRKPSGFALPLLPLKLDGNGSGRVVGWPGLRPLQPPVRPKKHTRALAPVQFISCSPQPSISNWHKGDVLILGANVRFRENNGHRLDPVECPLMTQSGH